MRFISSLTDTFVCKWCSSEKVKNYIDMYIGVPSSIILDCPSNQDVIRSQTPRSHAECEVHLALNLSHKAHTYDKK